RRLYGAKVFGVDAIEGVEVALHVREINGYVEHLLQRAATLFEDCLHVLDARARLNLDVVLRDVPGRIAHDSWNLAATRLAWTDAGQEEKVADASRVRIR